MPLNEQEREWLERRDVLCNHCDLIARGLCSGHNKKFCSHWDRYHCNNPVKRYKAFQDMQDAAKFEARVARELTNPTGDYMPLCIPDDCDFHDRHNCRECRLMHARFAVEAEMEAGK